MANGRTGDRLGTIRLQISGRISRSACARADQSGCAPANRLLRNRQLDGGRNSVAREDCTVGSSGPIILGAARQIVSRNTLRRRRIAPHHQPELRRSAAELADPSKVETRRRLPATWFAVTKRNDWRPNNRVVSALPASSKLVATALWAVLETMKLQTAHRAVATRHARRSYEIQSCLI